MNLNVTSPRPNQPPTVIYLKRKKICLKGISSKAFSSRQESPTMNKDVEEEINENLTFDEENDDDPSLLLYLSCGAISLAFVLGVISGVAIWRRKIYRGKISTTLSVKDNRNLLMSTDTTESKNTTIQTKTNISSPEKVYTGTMATTLPTSFSVNSYASIYKEPLESKRCSEILAPHCHQTSPQGSDIYESSCCSNNSDNEVAKEVFNIVDDPQRLKSCLGCHPCYCEVQTRLPGKPDLFIIKENFKQLQVLVKTLRESSDIGSMTELCQEGTKLAKLRHSNLLTIVGLSIISNAPPFLVYPDPLGCNFKLFLKSKRFPLKISEIIEISMQASKGISFLHANNILHEDIATRNCFLCDNFQIRLTDCALAKEFFPEDYENLNSEESHLGSCVSPTEDVFVPLRWMAIETLTEYTQTSTSSDVVSGYVFR
ncbi:Tyrosine-protein kinase RYK [Armadillidium nasatum]|uniref:Tyrosine-protein kinase RYK n=1 Tax=Armadillidium nasatum TaxID=96803 RepID=A0A5N5TDT3_9CRUS|nr:Tyrosine-protein kinase RYK [Armadillidium nasatum]